jgi:hypothetical protein
MHQAAAQRETVAMFGHTLSSRAPVKATRRARLAAHGICTFRECDAHQIM